MCDYSLHHVKSRPAKVGDKLTTHNFSTGTCGFAAPEDSTMAVCILPGTELAFSAEVLCAPSGLFRWKTRAINSRTAIFRQILPVEQAFSLPLCLSAHSVSRSCASLCSKPRPGPE